MGKIIRMTLEEALAKEPSAEDLARYERLANLSDDEIDFSDCPKIDFSHGGARPGAGRKPLGNVRITIQLPQGRVAQIRAVAKREKKTLSAVVNESLVLR